MPAMYSSAAIANGFLRLAELDDQSLDPMKIQKLVYLAHGWHLGHGRGPMCREAVQAWRWGPVFPDLYHEVKKWGMDAIEEMLTELTVRNGKLRVHEPAVEDAGSFEARIIRGAWKVYGQYSGPQLSIKTHEEGSPWKQVWTGSRGRRNAVIPNDLIASYYEEKVRAGKAARAAAAS